MTCFPGRRQSIVFVLLCSTCLMVAGCGDGGAAIKQRRNNLATLASIYTGDFYREQGRSPESITELAAFTRGMESAGDDHAEAARSLEEGDIVMIWNADLSQQRDPDAVLGFEARAPASGGYIVTTAGEVQLFTAKDFSEATMAPQKP